MSAINNTTSPVILITGCSSGIGREIALEALGRGFRVIATARKVDTMVDLETKGAKIFALDITDNQETLQNFGRKAIGTLGHVDILVNNAGYFQWGAIEEVSPAQLQAQFATNVFGTINLTNVFVPHFRERKTGTIVNISSQVAYISFPGAGIYGATKATLDYVSKVWAKELAPFRIRSLSVCPGQFRSAVTSNMMLEERELDCYKEVHETRDAYRGNGGNEAGDPKKAAQKILDIVMQSGRDLPGRFALGEDAVQYLEEAVRGEIKEIEAWREYGRGTNVDV